MTHRLRPLLGELVGRGYRGMSLGRERIDRALEGLGRPHDRFAAVHVAGTNGKGSVCAMVEAAARSQGLKTGLYTSPHLCRIAERIQIDGRPIDEDRLADGLARVLGAEPTDLTFFETLTAVAFDVFAREAVDVAVIEVGLGGRHDATNVIERPLATAITSVDFDHENLLGFALREIAGEKAGILKPGVAAVIGEVGAVAAEVIQCEADRVGSGALWWVERDGEPRGRAPAIRYRAGGEPSVTMPDGRALRVPGGLLGTHQVANTAVAWGLLHWIAPRVERWDHERAIAAISEVRWPGRLERIDGEDLARPVPSVRVLLDCAHNPSGARALAAHLEREALSTLEIPARRVLIYGALADKAWRPCLEAIAPLADHRVYTCPKGRPPAAPGELAALAPGACEPDPRAAVDRALHCAAELSSHGAPVTVIVTGSIYLVGEIRAHLLGLEADPVIAL